MKVPHHNHLDLSLKQHHQQHQALSTSRVRTSFDPVHELPRLHRWFQENPHPTRLTLRLYVKELNSLPSRRSRKLLEIHNLCYWFKNARAAYKRAELRMKRQSEQQQPAQSPSESSTRLTNNQNQQQRSSNLLNLNLNLSPIQSEQLMCHSDRSMSPSSSPPSPQPPQALIVARPPELKLLRGNCANQPANFYFNNLNTNSANNSSLFAIIQVLFML